MKDRPKYDEYSTGRVAYYELDDWLNAWAGAGWDVVTVFDRSGRAFVVLGR